MRAGRSVPMLGLLATAFLLQLPVAVGATGVEVALLPAMVEVLPGEIFDLEITIPVAGDSLNGYETTVEFDPTALDFIPLSPTTLQQGELMTSVCGNRWHLFNETDGVITISHILLCAGVKVAGPGVLYRLRFQARDAAAVTAVSFTEIEVYDAGTFVLPVSTADAEIRIGDVTAVPDGSAGLRGGLLPPMPNPFHRATRLTFSPGESGPARLDIYSVTGRRVRRVWEGEALEGQQYAATWDGRDGAGRRVGAGVYLIRFAGPEGVETGRVVLLP